MDPKSLTITVQVAHGRLGSQVDLHFREDFCLAFFARQIELINAVFDGHEDSIGRQHAATERLFAVKQLVGPPDHAAFALEVIGDDRFTTSRVQHVVVNPQHIIDLEADGAHLAAPNHRAIIPIVGLNRIVVGAEANHLSTIGNDQVAGPAGEIQPVDGPAAPSLKIIGFADALITFGKSDRPGSGIEYKHNPHSAIDEHIASVDREG